MDITPRTDAALCRLNRAGGVVMDLVGFGKVVKADFARELERENRKLRHALETLMVPYNDAKQSGLPSGVYVQRFRFEIAEETLR